MIRWLERRYRAMKASRGKKHTYLGMDLDFSTDGEVSLSMINYLEEIISSFSERISGGATTPAANHLFDVDDECEKLLEELSR